MRHLFLSLLIVTSPALGLAADLHVGAATVDITPDRPVALDGQMHVRISEKPETPIFVSALALESREGDQSLDQALMVSCDLVGIRQGLIELVREKAKDKLAGFDLNKLFLNATHTHTAPVTMKGDRYSLIGKKVMMPMEYTEFMVDRIVEAVLFFWDLNDKLIATAVNVPCPAQEVEGLKVIHADFWDPVRRQLRERHGQDLHILGWTGAGGDQVPRPMYGKAADERMRRLRGLTRLEEVARRVVRGWEEAHEGAKLEPVTGAVLRHHTEKIDLPWRKVTAKELADAQKGVEQHKDDPKEQWKYLWNKGVVDRYETEKAGTSGVFQMELHALRLGDVAIATNEFELFTDYGVQMKARSPAVQTFLIQLTGSGGYLPTPRAVAGGSYSAIIQSSRVGPEGGQVLVDETVKAFNALWPAAASAETRK